MSTVNVQASRRFVERHRWTRIIGLAIVVVMIATALAAVLAPTAHADDGDDFSLYKVASSAASYFSDRITPDKGGTSPGLGDNWQDIGDSASSGGSLLGYADQSITKGFNKWFQSNVSGSAQTIQYSALESLGPHSAGPLKFARFGAANADLGLDSMHSGFGGASVFHFLGGGLMLIVYLLSYAASWIMGLVIRLLQLLNPFAWFRTGIENTTFASALSGDTKVPGVLGGAVGFIGNIYRTITDLSWSVLVPVFVGVLIVGVFLFKDKRGSRIKNFIIRILFIALGVPLIGGTYTSILDQFGTDLSTGSNGPTKTVLSTYVDFGQWMTQDRLAVPSKATIAWNANSNHATAASQMQVRNTALAINVQSYKGALDKSIQAGSAASTAKSAWAQGNPDGSGGTATSGQSMRAVTGMLGRYLKSTSINASDFETGIKNAISTTKVDADPKKDWFKDQGWFKDQDDKIKDQDASKNPLISVKTGTGLAGSTNGGTTRFTTSASATKIDCGYRVSDHGGAPYNCNLAPLAAYNYLNSSFDSTSMQTFSSNKVASSVSRQSHDSVSQVGTGPTAFLYWANAIAMLGSIAVIGFTYALAMLVGVLKRGFASIGAVPLAALGSLRSIGKVLVYGIVMIGEVIMTVFLYQLVSMFITSVPGIIEGPFASFVTGSGVGATAGTALSVTVTIVSILLIAGVTIALLRMREMILKGIDEGSTRIVDGILGPTTPDAQTAGRLAAMSTGAGGSGSGSTAARMASGAGRGMRDNATRGAIAGAAGAIGRDAVESHDGHDDDDVSAGGLDGNTGASTSTSIDASTSSADAPDADASAVDGALGTDSTPGTNGRNGQLPDTGTSVSAPGSVTAGSDKDDQALAKRVDKQGGLTDSGKASTRTGELRGGRSAETPRHPRATRVANATKGALAGGLAGAGVGAVKGAADEFRHRKEDPKNRNTAFGGLGRESQESRQKVRNAATAAGAAAGAGVRSRSDARTIDRAQKKAGPTPAARRTATRNQPSSRPGPASRHSSADPGATPARPSMPAPRHSAPDPELRSAQGTAGTAPKPKPADRPAPGGPRPEQK